MVEGQHGGARPFWGTAWWFHHDIEGILFKYADANEEFDRPSMASLSPQMLDALVRAYADLDPKLRTILLYPQLNCCKHQLFKDTVCDVI